MILTHLLMGLYYQKLNINNYYIKKKNFYNLDNLSHNIFSHYFIRESIGDKSGKIFY